VTPDFNRCSATVDHLIIVLLGIVAVPQFILAEEFADCRT
jgi:hypothetical protein